MTDFGRYRLSYEPGPHDPYSGVLESAVEMSISGEAELPQLTDFFDSFLRAAGYVFDGKVQIVKPERKPDYHTSAPVSSVTSYSWGDDGFSLTGNPYFAPDTLGSSGILGGVGNDVISLG